MNKPKQIVIFTMRKNDIVLKSCNIDTVKEYLSKGFIVYAQIKQIPKTYNHY